MTTGNLAAIFGTHGPVLLPEEKAFFREADPFGFILFARNVETPEQLRRLNGDLREAVGRDAPILIDQEGGRVQRLRAPYWREWTPALETVEYARDPARAMWIRARLIAEELRGLGIDCNCAPNADIAGVETHAFLRNRCYGSDVETVTAMARAVAEAHLAAGVVPVIKHLPGHGRATADSHLHLPHVTASRAELLATDFAPFKALSNLPMAMTAHIVFEAYDASAPATQSPEMIRVIREVIGFKGLLMTDDLNMQALSGTLAERTAQSILAGCDLALHCKGDLAEMQMVASAAGQQSAATRARGVSALHLRQLAEPVDIKALEAEFATLMPQA